MLLILCDGQVTSERETADAIVEASNYPLSIVVIGILVGCVFFFVVKKEKKKSHFKKALATDLGTT